MIRRLAIAAAAAAAFEGAALACVCIPPEDREMAGAIAANAVAVAEVVEVEPMNFRERKGELYRVLQVHVGEAPESFRLARDFGSNGDAYVLMTSCDARPAPGEREVVVLYAAEGESQPDCGESSSTYPPQTLTMGNTCVHMFLQQQGALDLIREEARKLGRPVH